MAKKRCKNPDKPLKTKDTPYYCDKCGLKAHNEKKLCKPKKQ